MVDEENDGEILEDEARQLHALQQDSEAFFKRRLILWGLRWAIGFAVIWAVVAYQPAWSWLWWAGAGVAALSLITILVGRVLLNRRLARSRAVMTRSDD